MKDYVVIYNSRQTPSQEKSSFPSSEPKCSNQITGFFKMEYLKKEARNQVSFLHMVERQSFPQVDNIVLVGGARHVQSSQSNKFSIS